MSEMLEKITISDFRIKIKKYSKNPDAEAVVMHSGKPIGVFMGVNAWRAMQETLYLLKSHPESLLKSLVLHRHFQETGKAEGVSLEEFELLLKQGKLKS